MGFYIVEHLLRQQIGAQLTAAQNGLGHNILRSLTADKTGFQAAIDLCSLDSIALGIIEKSDPRHLVGIVFLSLVFRHQSGAHIPAFAIEQDTRIHLIHRLTDCIHRFYIVNAHQIKAEAIDIELPDPIEQRVNHELTEHLMLTGRFAANSRSILERAVGIHTIVIIRHSRLKGRIIGGIDMIVNHIQCHRDPRIMVGLNHRFQITDGLRWVSRIAGKAGFRSIVILRVVAPVVGDLSCLVIVLVPIGDWLQLNDIDAQLSDIVKPCRLTQMIFSAGLAGSQKGPAQAAGNP
ncbi:hypothetical protein STRDD11_01184 [Streptococcus sp. DD11]|nr:hypothetical protein STRDD11_01184 [Streptococcus sp. DD11]